MTAADIIGRQPETLYVTPSKPNPWYGTIIDGRPLTAQQYRAMTDAGLHPTHCETITVTRNATTREMYWPKGSAAPQYQFECPVLARGRDGSIKIISPSGLTETVSADGFVGRAKGGAK